MTCRSCLRTKLTGCSDTAATPACGLSDSGRDRLCMVNDFESVSKQWCDGEEVRLRDAVVLLSALQPAAAQLLERFAGKVSALPSCEKQEVFTNPELRKQLHGIYDSLLALHDDILVGAGGGDS